jgi:hypothetical protein
MNFLRCWNVEDLLIRRLDGHVPAPFVERADARGGRRDHLDQAEAGVLRVAFGSS